MLVNGQYETAFEGYFSSPARAWVSGFRFQVLRFGPRSAINIAKGIGFRSSGFGW